MKKQVVRLFGPGIVVVAVFGTLRTGSLITQLATIGRPQTMSRTTQSATNTSLPHHHPNDYQGVYEPAPVERDIYDQRARLGYDTKGHALSSGCNVWRDPSVAPAIHSQLHAFLGEVGQYYQRIQNFTAVEDLRRQLHHDGSNQDQVCAQVELHPDGLLEGIFPSGQLSRTRSGYIEPLFPPMRHPMFCWRKFKRLLDLSYLVHDFGTMCRRRLHRHSRTVLIDMGASLSFHGNNQMAPPIYLINMYRKFGFPFDHIYAYEITPTEPAQVFEALPDELRAAYHWINVGVDPTPGHKNNPLTLLQQNFKEDDFVVVKLDIDTPEVELALVRQILDTPEIASLIDQFYFEHHVHMQEIAFAWGRQVSGSVNDTLVLFHRLRELGIAAHFWV